jgi:hypothetical protein
MSTTVINPYMLEQSTPLQANLFTGELVDTRSSEQKRADRERQQPKQHLLFSQREVAQFGVRANPVMPLSPGKLQLISEDPRSEDEIEEERRQEAQRQTIPMFNNPEQPNTTSPLPNLNPSLLWLSREDLLQHRPDLSEAIGNMRDKELEVIGTLLLSMLHHFYSAQLETLLTLQLHLD